MSLEIVPRYRCNGCGLAIEVPQVAPFPFDGRVVVTQLPAGWSKDDAGQVLGCPAHPVRMVVPATVADGAETLRRFAAANGHKGH